MWVFKCYTNESGVDLIDEWLARQSSKVRAKYLERVSGLLDQPQHLWNGTRSKQLHGYEKLIELRFKASDKQYRPIGWFGPEKMQFTVLIGAVEKGGSFVPKDAPEQAVNRRANVLANPERAHVCNI